MNAVVEQRSVCWRLSIAMWVSLIVVAGLFAAAFYDGLAEMVRLWAGSEQYKHGFFVPVIALFLMWQKRDRLSRMPFEGAWTGNVVVVLGILLFVLGELSSLYVIVQYAFLVTLFGVVLALAGWRIVREIWAPLLFLVFMIPLPPFLYNGLAQQLQLISSNLGVFVIRLFGISVYLEGNVIDLGTYKLQVAEACSGIRYLFALTSMAFLCAYLFSGAVWKRAVIFLSSAPISIALNSLRIGTIGVLVEHRGTSMADGFLHEFESLTSFVAGMFLLFLEMAILARIGTRKEKLGELFRLGEPGAVQRVTEVRRQRFSSPYIAAVVLLVGAVAVTGLLAERTEIQPGRESFAGFPSDVGKWHGRRERLEQIYLDSLKLDDYIIADYVDGSGNAVNFYVAYYASQRKGQSAHSPRSCLPGGGWKIADLTRRPVAGVAVAGRPVRVNRVVIRMGEVQQLVYYWFQQRSRNMTSEYLVKWYLFWDALTRNRTDGALIRLTTLVRPGEELSAADERLTGFLLAVHGELGEYVPD